MFTFYRSLFLLSVAAASVAALRSQRTKRSLLDLAEGIECSTGKLAWYYLIYGCYCGIGGQGLPKDKTDWCCHKHDCCYGYAEKLGCKTKTAAYKWTCEDHTIECDDEEDHCNKLVCECDSDLAKCLKKTSKDNLKYTLAKPTCGNQKPNCDKYSFE